MAAIAHPAGSRRSGFRLAHAVRLACRGVPRRRLLRPAGGRPDAAPGAEAAADGEEVLVILLAVIVGDLLAGGDVAHGDEPDLALLYHWLRIGPAGMVHVARHV